MNDLRIILFLFLLYFVLFQRNKENFQVNPVLDGGKIETELNAQEFLNKNITDNKHVNTDDLYGMVDEVDRKVDKTEDYLNSYNPIFCQNNAERLNKLINKYINSDTNICDNPLAQNYGDRSPCEFTLSTCNRVWSKYLSPSSPQAEVRLGAYI